MSEQVWGGFIRLLKRLINEFYIHTCKDIYAMTAMNPPKKGKKEGERDRGRERNEKRGQWVSF